MSKSIDTFFRANVGAVILNSKNEVLTFERTKIKDAWQLPQGGMDTGEEPLDSVLREVEEETGLEAYELELLGTYPEWLVYEIPIDKRNKKIGRGQAQKWFFFRIKNEEKTIIDLEKAIEKEFSNWKWLSMDELLNVVVEFRKPIYAKLNDFMKTELKNKENSKITIVYQS